MSAELCSISPFNLHLSLFPLCRLAPLQLVSTPVDILPLDDPLVQRYNLPTGSFSLTAQLRPHDWCPGSVFSHLPSVFAAAAKQPNRFRAPAWIFSSRSSHSLNSPVRFRDCIQGFPGRGSSNPSNSNPSHFGRSAALVLRVVVVVWLMSSNASEPSAVMLHTYAQRFHWVSERRKVSCSGFTALVPLSRAAGGTPWTEK